MSVIHSVGILHYIRLVQLQVDLTNVGKCIFCFETNTMKLTSAGSPGSGQSYADTIAGSFSKAFRVPAGGRAKDTEDVIDFPGTEAA